MDFWAYLKEVVLHRLINVFVFKKTFLWWGENSSSNSLFSFIERKVKDGAHKRLNILYEQQPCIKQIPDAKGDLYIFLINTTKSCED